jgi:putative nucleotidyltransferase with HDIG domain
MSAIEDILAKIDFLPPLPGTLNKALQVIDSPDVAIKDILEYIQYDSALSANILKLCNSSFFALNRRISSLKEGIAIIGLAELRRMILFILSRRVFANEYRGYEARPGELWRHSIASAIIAAHLQKTYPCGEGDLFTAALLHDVGKMILSDHVAGETRKILELVREHGYTFLDAENEVIGMTHAEVGARIMSRWNFPSVLVESVRFHHHPEAVPQSAFTHFLALANIMALLLGYGTDTDGLATRGYPELYKQYGIKEKDLERILTATLEKIQDVEKMLV